MNQNTTNQTIIPINIETGFTHTSEIELARQRIEKAGFYIQSLFRMLKLSSYGMEVVEENPESYSADIIGMCELGNALAVSLFQSTLPLLKIEDDYKIDSQTLEATESVRQTYDTLAGRISSILNDPELPKPIYDGLSDTLLTLENDFIDQSEIRNQRKSPEYIDLLLKGYIPNESVQND